MEVGVWKDFLQEGQFKHSTVWLVDNELAVIISSISIFNEVGTFSLLCSSLGIYHEQINAASAYEAKREAMKKVHAKLTLFGNGFRAYLETQKKQENGI